MPDPTQDGPLAPEQILAGQVVQPFPVPSTVLMEVVEVDGRQLVAMQICSPVGMNVTFFPPDIAIGLAQRLDQMAHQAKLGLTIVTRQGPQRDPIIRGRG